jgi:hypothetical protein
MHVMSYTVSGLILSLAEEARSSNSASCGGTATHFSAEGVLLCRTLEKYFEYLNSDSLQAGEMTVSYSHAGPFYKLSWM